MRVYEQYCQEGTALQERALVNRAQGSAADVAAAQYSLQNLSPAWRRLAIPSHPQDMALPDDMVCWVLQHSPDGQVLHSAVLSRTEARSAVAPGSLSRVRQLAAQLPPGSSEQLQSLMQELDEYLGAAAGLLPMTADEAPTQVLPHLIILADEALLRLPLEALGVLQRPFKSVSRDFSLAVLQHRLTAPEGSSPSAPADKKGKKHTGSELPVVPLAIDPARLVAVVDDQADSWGLPPNCRRVSELNEARRDLPQTTALVCQTASDDEWAVRLPWRALVELRLPECQVSRLMWCLFCCAKHQCSLCFSLSSSSSSFFLSFFLLLRRRRFLRGEHQQTCWRSFNC